MKKWIFWSFERGSLQYDILCVLILVVGFAAPREAFNDRPDYKRIPESGVRQVQDRDGNDVYTVRVDASGDAPAAQAAARSQLRTHLASEEPLNVFRAEAVVDTRGRIQAYAFWLR